MAVRDAARDDVGAGDRQGRLRGRGEKGAGAGEAPIVGGRAAVGMEQGERVERALAAALEQQSPQRAEARRRLAVVEIGETAGDDRQPLGLGVGEAQPFAQPLGVFLDQHAQRGEAQQRVGRRVARRLDRRKADETGRIGLAGQQRQQQPGFANHGEHVGGARRDDELQQLGAHPFARQDRQTVALGDRRVEARPVEPAVAIAGREAEEAQDAQIVFADALARLADETDAAVGEIGEPADVVVHRPVARQRQRVDGEVAPQRIVAEVAAEGDRGVASVGVDVASQRRRLERPAVDDHRHGAVGEAGRRDAESGGARALHHDFRRRGGGEVEIADRRAEREVAHRAAHQPGLFAVAVQRGERAGEAAGFEQATVGEAPVLQAGQGAHSIRPGTRTPFSIWAGT